ncbi:MAG: tRNA pseudouridine(38-40) synthase TruA [Mariprofundaceae bacterium]|nr:tRNA pseudouridine(38-40) synthase TruA [Mariprofundaceae bacterium]
MELDTGTDIQRIAMVVEFDGRSFHGWQRQDNAITVQEVLERALSKMEGRPCLTVASGRTDAGVHAEAMLVHADVSKSRWQRSARAYTQGVNQFLSTGVVVIGVCAVKDDFHARFSCTERRYRYQIWNRSTPSALAEWRHWWMPRALDVKAMQQAADYMVGKHDFGTFQATRCQSHSAVREVRYLAVRQQGWEVTIDIHADGFLYHMVRNIVGNLVQVGIGKWQADYIPELMQQRNRVIGAATAPAQGLYFSDALYPLFSARELIGKESN